MKPFVEIVIIITFSQTRTEPSSIVLLRIFMRTKWKISVNVVIIDIVKMSKKKKLDVEFKSKEQLFWEEIRDSAEDALNNRLPEDKEAIEKQIKLNKAILEMAKDNLKKLK